MSQLLEIFSKYGNKVEELKEIIIQQINERKEASEKKFWEMYKSYPELKSKTLDSLTDFEKNMKDTIFESEKYIFDFQQNLMKFTNLFQRLSSFQMEGYVFKDLIKNLESAKTIDEIVKLFEKKEPEGKFWDRGLIDAHNRHSQKILNRSIQLSFEIFNKKNPEIVAEKEEKRREAVKQLRKMKNATQSAGKEKSRKVSTKSI